MFLPNNKGALSARAGHTKNGEFLFGPETLVRCSIVSLNHAIQKTPIRTDSSASRGRSDEDVSVSVILFPPEVRIKIGDRFRIANLDLRCSGAQPRYDVLGKFDHTECQFEAWSSRTS